MGPRDEDGKLDYEQELNLGITVGCPVILAAIALSLFTIWAALNVGPLH